jgi:hypothetical protein
VERRTNWHGKVAAALTGGMDKDCFYWFFTEFKYEYTRIT